MTDRLPPNWEAEAARGRAIAKAAGADLPAFQIQFDWPQYDPDSEPPGALLYKEGTVELLGPEDAVHALDGGGARVIGGIDRDGVRWRGPMLCNSSGSDVPDCFEHRAHNMVRLARVNPFRAAAELRRVLTAKDLDKDDRRILEALYAIVEDELAERRVSA